MSFLIYNSADKKIFPLQEKDITMYVCGVTVYDRIHIGNARTAVFFDTVYRLLSIEHNVRYVNNVTDIDQKIIDKAHKQSVSWRQISELYTKYMHLDYQYLGISNNVEYHHATKYISHIIDIIEKLLNNDDAYIASDGVYFKEHQDIQKLFTKSNNSNVSRIDSNTKAEEFALWKFRDQEPYWHTPWGNGIPGWHTECFAMIDKIFNTKITLHGGGKDLQFPHHENERLQCICINNHDLSKTWMHVNFLNLDAEKMSKSLQNIVQVHELHDKYPGEVIRLFLLKTHYRSEINFKEDGLYQAHVELDHMYHIKNNADSMQKDDVFIDIVKNDFNIPEAISYMMSLDDENKMAFCMHYLGFGKYTNMQWIMQTNNHATVNEILQKRQEARNNKNYILSDNLRDKLAGMGIKVQDNKADQSIRKLIPNNPPNISK